jgi:hypothetical protein
LDRLRFVTQDPKRTYAQMVTLFRGPERLRFMRSIVPRWPTPGTGEGRGAGARRRL